MTPAMNSGAPKGTQAPAAGLAALAQPAQMPRGMPQKGIQQIMESARKMSDAQLADVLSGKSMDVPQYVAMTEAMGRKSLRNAVQGQQAMAQAKQPSLKDKFLSEEAQAKMAQMMAQAPQMGGQGLAGLPAPNMDSMDMAGGGIIAFEEGGDVPGYAAGGEPLTDEEIQQILTRGGVRRKDEDIPENPLKGFGTSQRTRAAMKDAAKNMTPAQLDALALGQGVFSEGSAALPTAAPQVVPTGAQPDALNRFIAPAASNAAPAVAPRAPVTGVGTAPSAQPFSIPSYEQLQGKRSEDYLKKLEGLTEKQRAGLADIKKQGGGEALMQLAAAVMGSPTLAQAAAKGLPMVASTAAATRKEARAVENMANDYDLNLAKAREAAARGDMESALMFKKLSDDAKYKNSELGLRAAMLNQLPDSVRTAMALQKDPSLAQFFPNMTKANLIPRDKALAQWEDLTRSKQQKYGDFETYFKTMNNQLLSDTIPGQGANIRPYS